MSLVLGYATPANAIIMSDGRAGENGSYSEYYDKTMKVNDNIIMGFAGIMENIDMFLSCALKNMEKDRKYYLIDDFLEMVDFMMQDEETKSNLKSDFLIIGKNIKGKMFTCTVGMSTGYMIKKNAATSPRCLYIGGTVEGNAIDEIFLRNMRTGGIDIKSRMENTIREAAKVDKSINCNTFFRSI